MTRTRKLPLALAMAAALLLAVPAGAAAKGKKKKPDPVSVVRVTGTTTVQNGDVTVTATCPKKTVAVGGGFRTLPATEGKPTFDMNVVFASWRSGNRSWSVSAARADNDGAGPSLPVTASAQCLAARVKRGKKIPPPRLTEATADVLAGNGTFGNTATAACPAGLRVISGGFTSQPIPTFSPSVSFPIVHANHRAGIGSWTVGFANSSLISRTLTTRAYCAARLKPLALDGSAVLPAAGPGYSSTLASGLGCPRRRPLIAGGFSNTPTQIAGTAAPVAMVSALTGRAWTDGAVNISSTAGTLGPQSICL